MSINSITLVGRAGRDPEVRYFESGTMVANLTLAVNRRSRDEDPDWFNLEIWGKTAQFAADYVKKGSLIGVIGSLCIDKWTDKVTGEVRSKPVIKVDRLQLLGSKRNDDHPGDATPAAGPADSSLPRPATQTSPPVWDGGGAVAGEDIPFASPADSDLPRPATPTSPPVWASTRGVAGDGIPF
jgi:single-strand DNA-binding protein